MCHGLPNGKGGGPSGPVAALAGAKSTRDKVRRADRFAELAVNGEPVEQFLGSLRRNAGTLNPQTGESLHRSGLLDEAPLSRATTNVIEQSEADGGKVGFLPRNHKDGQAQVPVQKTAPTSRTSPRCSRVKGTSSKAITCASLGTGTPAGW
jgi:hypothetical protein